MRKVVFWILIVAVVAGSALLLREVYVTSPEDFHALAKLEEIGKQLKAQREVIRGDAVKIRQLLAQERTFFHDENPESRLRPLQDELGPIGMRLTKNVAEFNRVHADYSARLVALLGKKPSKEIMRDMISLPQWWPLSFTDLEDVNRLADDP